MSDLLKYIDACRADNSYTPDLFWLYKRYTSVPLFCYGTEKFGYSDHSRLRGFPRLGFGMTIQSDFRMYVTNEHQPFILQETTGQRGKVFGEVYCLPIDILATLDAWMGNTVHFERKLTQVKWYGRNEKKEKVWFHSPMFIYVGDKHLMSHKLLHGDAWLKPFVDRKDEHDIPYSHFRPEDDMPNRDTKVL